MSTALDHLPEARWLEAFRRERGRAPRILHIGNIANNAYNIAKLLNEAGFDCDVICYDYYHIMGCPEWEESDFDGAPDDQFNPNWSALGLRGYRPPRWFAQGPQATCLRYLIARRRRRRLAAAFWWRMMRAKRDVRSATPGRWVVNRLRNLRVPFQTSGFEGSVVPRGVRQAARYTVGHWTEAAARLVLGLVALVALVVQILLYPFRRLARRMGLREIVRRAPSEVRALHFDDRARELVAAFAEAFPDRPDRLTAADLEMYRGSFERWKELFRHYDLVQAYATDPIYPLLAAKRPYVAFEHGTLRTFTLDDDATHRRTALAYRLSDHAFITNGDCLEYAERLGVPRHAPMLHPVDERRVRRARGDHDGLHRAHDAEHVFLCTLRHDWEIKGTDRYIRALPRLRETLGPRIKVLMTTWGAQVEESRRLARTLGVDDLIEWIEPLCRTRLLVTLKSVDALFDQIALPHFGATAPEAIAAEVPVIMSYDPASTAWIVPRPAPILSARTTEEIVTAVRTAVDPAWRRDYRSRARAWVDECHSAAIVVSSHARVYGALLVGRRDPTEPLPDDEPDRQGVGAEASLRELREDARLQHDRA